MVTVDVVLQKNGWFGDGAWTYIVGSCSSDLTKMVSFANDLIYKAVDSLKETLNLNIIGNIIEKECKKNNFRVLKEGAGHGIGQSIHEEPQISFNGESESIPLQTGMVFTIEPVITNSTLPLEYDHYGTAYLDVDSYAVQFEHMVAVNDWGIEILTERKPFFK